MRYFAHTYRTQHIDVNFDIDMRKFANFKLHQQDLEQIQEIPENGSPDRVILTEELVCDNQAIFVISNTISKFLQDQNQSGLRVFNPGLFIIDRQNPNDALRHIGSYLIFGEHWNFIIIAKVVFFMNSFGKKIGILKNSS